MEKVYFRDDVSYTSDDVCGLIANIVSDGIMYDSQYGKFTCKLTSGQSRTNVKAEVQGGTAIIKGHIYKTDEKKTLTIGSADPTMWRVYNIAIVYTKATQSFDLVVTKAYEDEAEPSLDYTSFTKENPAIIQLLLATVHIPPQNAPKSRAPILIPWHEDMEKCGLVSWTMKQKTNNDLHDQYLGVLQQLVQTMRTAVDGFDATGTLANGKIKCKTAIFTSTIPMSIKLPCVSSSIYTQAYLNGRLAPACVLVSRNQVSDGTNLMITPALDLGQSNKNSITVLVFYADKPSESTENSTMYSLKAPAKTEEESICKIYSSKTM